MSVVTTQLACLLSHPEAEVKMSFTSSFAGLHGTRAAAVSRRSLNEQPGFYTRLPSSVRLNDEEEEYIPKGEWFPYLERKSPCLSVLSVCGIVIVI